MNSDKNHLWGGRFNEPTDEFVKIFGASISFDKILALYDIEGSQAHATMLSEVGVLTSSEIRENMMQIFWPVQSHKAWF